MPHADEAKALYFLILDSLQIFRLDNPEGLRRKCRTLGKWIGEVPNPGVGLLFEPYYYDINKKRVTILLSTLHFLGETRSYFHGSRYLCLGRFKRCSRSEKARIGRECWYLKGLSFYITFCVWHACSTTSCHSFLGSASSTNVFIEEEYCI